MYHFTKETDQLYQFLSEKENLPQEDLISEIELFLVLFIVLSSHSFAHYPIRNSFLYTSGVIFKVVMELWEDIFHKMCDSYFCTYELHV